MGPVWTLAIALVLCVAGRCHGNTKDTSGLVFSTRPLPDVARRAIAQAQWTMDVNDMLLRQDFENLYDKILDWAQTGSNQSYCEDSLKRFAFDLWGRKSYTTKVLDATGKLESGVLRGNYKWYGRYFECESIKNENFRGKWCSIISGKKNPFMNTVDGLTIGICLPDTCTEYDVDAFISIFKKKNSSTVSFADCPVQPTQWKAPDIIFLVVFTFLIILLVVGTSLEMFINIHNERRKRLLVVDDVAVMGDISPINSNELPDWKQALLSFSLIKNTRTLLSVERKAGTIDCIHGMRFVSMTWVVLGHVFIFSVTKTDNILDAYEYTITHFSAHAIINAYFSVDSFFMIGGFLVAYLSLKNDGRLTARKVPMMYIQRYLRITPAYAFILLMMVGILGKLGDGPVWPSTFQADCDICQKYWWTNILYINNLHPSSLLKECYALGWYLANDMQFFLLAPISLLIYKRKPMLGVAALLYGILSSMIATAVISAHYKLQPTPVATSLLLSGASGSLLHQMPPMSPKDVFWSDTYAKPWCRIGVYLIGMLTGCLLATTKCNIRMNKAIVTLGWVLAAALNLAVLYGTWGYVQNVTRMSVPLASFYDAMCRPVWACGLAWVIVACACGYGGPVNAFLSWKPLIPLSRLTYCTYLIHPMVISLWFGTSEVNFHYSTTQFAFQFLGILTMATGAAYILSMLVEAPFVNLIKFVFERRSRQRVPLPQHQQLVNEAPDQ